MKKLKLEIQKCEKKKAKLSGKCLDIEADIDDLRGEQGILETKIGDIDDELKELREEEEMLVTDEVTEEDGSQLRKQFRILSEKIANLRREPGIGIVDGEASILMDRRRTILEKLYEIEK